MKNVSYGDFSDGPTEYIQTTEERQKMHDEIRAGPNRETGGMYNSMGSMTDINSSKAGAGSGTTFNPK